MARNKTRVRQNKSETRHKQRKTTDVPKTATRKMRITSKVKLKVRSAKASSKPQQHHTSAGTNRSEGIRLFALAGRPTKEQFVRVYGERGPKMTWDERTKAGVSARQFQAALAAKQ
jgi:hypothetical protein